MILIVSAVTYKLSFPKDFTFAGQQLDFSSFTPLALIMIIVYFILGYSLYAMLNAVAGATVSKAEDVNSAVMPISLITLVAFYFAYATIAFPEGGIAVVSSIIPFSAPFSMPCRLLMSDVPAWQIIASVTVLILTIAFATWISVRIYSSAVLHYGKRLKVKDLVKMTNKL
jgi:ABC-2 type transport system permease protein